VTQRRDWLINKNVTTWLLVVLALVAFGLRLWGIGFGLPFTYHPDEYQYVEDALGFFSGDLNPHRFNNPALFKYFLFGEYILIRHIAPQLGPPTDQASLASFYWLGRLTNALLGTATVLLLYLTGRRAYSSRAGLLAAAFLAVAFLHARESHYAVNDVPLTLLAVVGLWLCLCVLQRGTAGDYLLAGAVAGLAAGTKYTGAFLAVPLAVAYSLKEPWRRRDTMWLFSLGRFALALAAMGIAFLVTNPFALLDFPAFAEDLQALAGRGALGYKGLILDPAGGWVFYLKTLNWGLGYGLFLLSLIGLAYAGYQRSRQDLVLISFPLILYLFLGRQQMFFARFILPAVPVLLLLAARVLTDVITAIAATNRQRNLALAALSLAVLIQPTGSLLRHDLLLTRTDTRTLARAWIEAHIPPGAVIVSEPYGPPLDEERYRVQVTDSEGLPWHDSTLERYRQAGAQYLIASSFVYDRVYRDPRQAQARQTFYAALEVEADRLQEFRPYRGPDKPPFLFDQVYGPVNALFSFERPGPVIRVYRLTAP